MRNGGYQRQITGDLFVRKISRPVAVIYFLKHSRRFNQIYSLNCPQKLPVTNYFNPFNLYKRNPSIVMHTFGGGTVFIINSTFITIKTYKHESINKDKKGIFEQ